MRKILMGLIIIGFALVLFITLKPQLANLLSFTDSPAIEAYDGQIKLDPAPYFSVVQGESELALYVRNNMSEVASFSLGHEHEYLTFRPQGDRLAAGSVREVFVQVDPRCPVGEIELPVYLRAESDGERITEDTVIMLNVIPGELSLEYDQYGLKVLWNGETAPRGVSVYYRPLGHNQWQEWGETPRIGIPEHLGPGDYEFEFVAELGEVRSEIERFAFTIEEPEEPKKVEANDSVAVSSGRSDPAPDDEPSAPATVVDMPFNRGTYTGSVNSDGLPDGNGTWLGPRGITYTGAWKDGKPHGHGTMTHPTEGAKKGTWEDGDFVEESANWFDTSGSDKEGTIVWGN